MLHYIYIVDPKANPNEVDVHCLEKTVSDILIFKCLCDIGILNQDHSYRITTSGNCSLVIKK
jgi:hypothetical protein